MRRGSGRALVAQGKEEEMEANARVGATPAGAGAPSTERLLLLMLLRPPRL